MKPAPALQIALAAALFFAAGIALFTRENQFPFFRHPDEPVKVAQVQTGKWNFHHPMLLLSTARLAVAATSVDRGNPQAVVETGRWVSAGFAAGAAALLAAAIWLAAGRVAGIATGLLLLTNHQLFELAHYFKEDTALLFGIGAWFFSLALYERKTGWGRAALLGVGAALAVSGKYVGAFAPLLSLFVLARPALGGRRWPCYAAFAVALTAALVLLNAPMLQSRAASGAGLHREVGLVVHGQRGMTRSVPHGVYLSAFRDNLHSALWPLIAVTLWSAWRRRKLETLSITEAATLLIPIAFLLALSCSPKTHDRYFLPATALFLCSAALGLKALGQKPAALPPLLLLVAAGLQFAGQPRHDLLSYYRAFQTDDRADLAAWLNARAAKGKDDVIAQDRRTQLPSAEHAALLAYQPKLSARVLPQDLEKCGGMDELRAQGVTLAALCQDDFGRFELKSLRPRKDADQEAYRRTAVLYQALRAGRAPLWERPRGLVLYLHPGLMVYPMPE